MLDRALAWAAAGWPVFPCSSTGHPAIKEWQKKATTDEAIIRAWDWKDKRVAAVPGLAGCFVIDVDVKNGKDGEASLAKLEAEHDFEAWEYPQQSTPTGGRHIFLFGQAPSSVQRLLGEGLDTRGGTGEGGLGFVYAYGDEPPCATTDCLVAPPGLLQALAQGKREVSEDRETPRVELDQPANVERALSFVRNLPSPDEGQRNINVFKTACTLKDLGLSLSKIFEVLEDHPSVTGNPPLCEENEEEFNATVRSAYKNGQRQPGIDAIDEGTRNRAAEGFDLGEAREQAPHGRGKRKLTYWSERRSRPKPPWLVRGVFAKNSLAGVYGPGGAYKSFVALDLACTLASGKKTWLERDVRAEGPVVYISGEGTIDPRVRAWEKHHNTMVSDNLAVWDGIDLADAAQLESLLGGVAAAKEEKWGGKGPVLVIVDTLARATPGQEENATKDMGEIADTCNSLRLHFQCCVMLVHHTPKGSRDWRGAIAMWNALDTGLLVEKVRPLSCRLKLVRQKDGMEGMVWRGLMKQVPTGFPVEEGDEPETSLVLEGVAEDAAEPETMTAPKDEAIRKRQITETIAVEMNRGQIAEKYLVASGPEVLVPELAKWMETEGVRGAAAWLRSVFNRGALNTAHPLAPRAIGTKAVTGFRGGVIPPEGE
jgi:hypothetical protein